MTSDGTWTYTWEHGRQLAGISGTILWFIADLVYYYPLLFKVHKYAKTAEAKKIALNTVMALMSQGVQTGIRNTTKNEGPTFYQKNFRFKTSAGAPLPFGSLAGDLHKPNYLIC